MKCDDFGSKKEKLCTQDEVYLPLCLLQLQLILMVVRPAVKLEVIKPFQCTHCVLHNHVFNKCYVAKLMTVQMKIKIKKKNEKKIHMILSQIIESTFDLHI